ncbi:hypothetical protein ScPMuIL_015627 [Solemya velum]
MIGLLLCLIIGTADVFSGPVTDTLLINRRSVARRETGNTPQQVIAKLSNRINLAIGKIVDETKAITDKAENFRTRAAVQQELEHEMLMEDSRPKRAFADLQDDYDFPNNIKSDILPSNKILEDSDGLGIDLITDYFDEDNNNDKILSEVSKLTQGVASKIYNKRNRRIAERRPEDDEDYGYQDREYDDDTYSESDYTDDDSDEENSNYIDGNPSVDNPQEPGPMVHSEINHGRTNADQEEEDGYESSNKESEKERKNTHERFQSSEPDIRSNYRSKDVENDKINKNTDSKRGHHSGGKNRDNDTENRERSSDTNAETEYIRTNEDREPSTDKIKSGNEEGEYGHLKADAHPQMMEEKEQIQIDLQSEVFEDEKTVCQCECAHKYGNRPRLPKIQAQVKDILSAFEKKKRRARESDEAATSGSALNEYLPETDEIDFQKAVMEKPITQTISSDETSNYNIVESAESKTPGSIDEQRLDAGLQSNQPSNVQSPDSTRQPTAPRLLNSDRLSNNQQLPYSESRAKILQSLGSPQTLPITQLLRNYERQPKAQQFAALRHLSNVNLPVSESQPNTRKIADFGSRVNTQGAERLQHFGSQPNTNQVEPLQDPRSQTKTQQVRDFGSLTNTQGVEQFQNPGIELHPQQVEKPQNIGSQSNTQQVQGFDNQPNTQQVEKLQVSGSELSAQQLLDSDQFADIMDGRTEQPKVHIKHLGGAPNGPVALEESLEQEFLNRFSDNVKETIPWVEPTLLDNCWAQAMLGKPGTFSPSCNADGSFGPKQCFLERCWCVNHDGSPQEQEDEARFYYSVTALMVKCSQNA